MKFDEKWDLQWYKERSIGRESVFHKVANICQEFECKSVLDVGGGVGIMRHFLREDIRYDVVDLSSSAKLYGEHLFPDVQFITGRVEDVKDQYCAIIGMQVVEHMPEYETFLKYAWEKAKKIVVLTFRNGLDETETIKLQNRCNDYWDNKYSLPKLANWINANFHPVIGDLIEVDIRRDYSPELILTLWKGYT